MGLAERIEKLIPEPSSSELKSDLDKANQLKDLEKAEATLKSIGVSLEPKFNVSLAARTGMAIAATKKQ